MFWGDFPVSLAVLARSKRFALVGAVAAAHVGALLPFLMSLPKEDWDYLGNGLKLGEKDKIVFWHKDQMSKKYRAVYGDLTAKEIDPADLPAKK